MWPPFVKVTHRSGPLSSIEAQMPRHIVIIQGHPDPAGGHLCHALADAYAEGAQMGGHQVSRIEVAALDFPFMRSIAEPDLPEALVGAKAAVLAADHIVVIFPYLWLKYMPAPLKAFFHQIMGFRAAWFVKGMPQESFEGRSARIIVTIDMPVPSNRIYFFGGYFGVDDNQRFKRDMSEIGIAPIRGSIFGMIPIHVRLFDMINAANTRKWLEQMRELGAGAL
jgi:putative NADPH-quinone reductase